MPRPTITLALLALACSSRGDESPSARADSAIPAAAPAREDLTAVDTALAPSLGVTLAGMTRSAGGVYVLDKVTGKGPVAELGKTVTVHYTGWLANGRAFDSSRDAGGKPISFPLGRAAVIKGWDEGIAGMRAGGRRLLVIPPALGYGAAGKPGTVPSRATLVFEVELRSVK
ncbi:MAG: FKBP-type peptidyl-prolyl cis-trans isomerase [Gemmatimonadaceae bacterium]